MSEKTEIAWTDSTFNPWWGCQKVGPGCDHCYAETLDKRTGGAHWGPGAERRRTSVRNWNDPIRWNKKADAFFAEHGRRQRVFCSSMADVFDNAVDPVWRDDLFSLIASTQNLDWLLLTKRIGNAATMLPWLPGYTGPDGQRTKNVWRNVWIGATIVNQAEANRDIPKLLAVPAAKRFLSMEPLLGPVTVFDLDGPVDVPDGMKSPIDWVIVGGESGPNARPMHPDWARSLRDQCQAAGVPFLFKQWGEFICTQITLNEDRPHICAIDHVGDSWAISMNGGKVSHLGPKAAMWTLYKDSLPVPRMVELHRIGKKAAGRLLDGRTWDEVPA